MKESDVVFLGNSECSSGCECLKGDTENHCNLERRDMLKYFALVLPAMTGAISCDLLAEDSEKNLKKLPPQIGDRLTFYSRRKRGPIVRWDDLTISDRQILVLPLDPKTGLIRDGSRYNQILLQRFSPEDLTEETRAISAQGVVAYSSICTHNGCPVTGWMKEEKHYMCPCHQSVFNPMDSGVVLSGPAPRKLPALPLGIEDGELVVAANFTSWIGFGKRKRR